MGSGSLPLPSPLSAVPLSRRVPGKPHTATSQTVLPPAVSTSQVPSNAEVRPPPRPRLVPRTKGCKILKVPCKRPVRALTPDRKGTSFTLCLGSPQPPKPPSRVAVVVALRIRQPFQPLHRAESKRVVATSCLQASPLLSFQFLRLLIATVRVVQPLRVRGMGC